MSATDKNKRGMTLAYPMLISYLLSLLLRPSRSKHGRAVRNSRSLRGGLACRC